MKERECNNCERTSTNMKQCGGCRKNWYCNSSCQKAAWRFHKIYCKDFSDMTTAERLTRFVYEDRIPDDERTRLDFGFEKALTPENESKLLGLYIGLIQYQELDPKFLHKWRVEGSLIQEIKAYYESIPPINRGGYYPWFLEHQYLLDPTISPPSTLDDVIKDATVRAWRFIGGAQHDTFETIRTVRDTWSKYRQMCFMLWLLLLMQWHPSPNDNLWISFGFCTCKDEWSETKLSRRYQELIEKCSFDDFCTAFEHSGLWDLLCSRGSPIEEDSDLASVLRTSPHMNYSVWDLKALVSVEIEGTQPVRPIMVDYGFYNCKTIEERVALRSLYKKYFEAANAQPLELHKACIAGKLFAHVSQFVKIKKTDHPMYRRLMQNFYPLPEFPEEPASESDQKTFRSHDERVSPPGGAQATSQPTGTASGQNKKSKSKRKHRKNKK